MLITPDEEKRVETISDSKYPTTEEAHWLCGVVKRLAQTKPMEEAFPTYTALVNPHTEKAFAMKFAGRAPFERTVSIDGGFASHSTATLLDLTTECAISDAHLCIRPYIRVLGGTGRKNWSPTEKAIIQELTAYATLRVVIDGEPVVDNEPVEAYLVALDGYGLHRKPTDFRHAGNSLFRVGHFAGNSQEVFMKDHGIFLPNASKIEMVINGLRLKKSETLHLSAGMVMALYTTRGTEGTIKSEQKKQSLKGGS